MTTTYRDLVHQAYANGASWTFAQVLDQTRFALHFKYHLRDIQNSLSRVQHDLNQLELVPAFHHSIVLSMLYELICPAPYTTASQRFQNVALQGGTYLAQFHPHPVPERREDIDFAVLSQASLPHLLKVVTGWLDRTQLIHAKEVAGLYLLFNEYARAKKDSVSSIPDFERQADRYMNQVEQEGIAMDDPFEVWAERFS